MHLVVNDCGEILNIKITAGNVDAASLFPTCSKDCLAKYLVTVGIFFAKPKRNMKKHLMDYRDKLLSRKRSIVESIIDQLKNISQIEHSCHRSVVNAMVNIIAGLIAYCHQPKKTSLHTEGELQSFA